MWGSVKSSVGAISAKMAWFLALKARALLHQLSSFFKCHGIVGTGNDIDVHCVRVFFSSSEHPSQFGFFFLLRFSSIDESHESMIVSIELESPVVPFAQGGGWVSQIHDLLQKWDLDGPLKIVQSSWGVFFYPRVVEKDFES